MVLEAVTETLSVVEEPTQQLDCTMQINNNAALMEYSKLLALIEEYLYDITV